MQTYTGFNPLHGGANPMAAAAASSTTIEAANDVQMVRLLQTLLQAEPQAVQASGQLPPSASASGNPALTAGNVSGCSSLPIVTIQCLLESVKSSSSTTFQEFMIEVGRSAEKLRLSSYNTISMVAGSGLFIRWISRQPFMQDEPFESWKARVLEYGARMVKSCYGFRDKAASSGLLFIKDDQVGGGGEWLLHLGGGGGGGGAALTPHTTPPTHTPTPTHRPSSSTPTPAP